MSKRARQISGAPVSIHLLAKKKAGAPRPRPNHALVENAALCYFFSAAAFVSVYPRFVAPT